MKIIIIYIISLYLLLSCSREINNFELRKEIKGFKINCSMADFPKANYVYYSLKSTDGIWWKGIQSKKGRVQCGEEYFDFNAVYSDGSKLAYIDVTYKQKTTRLAEFQLSESKSDLFDGFDVDDFDLKWQENRGQFVFECIFDSKTGSVYSRKL